MTKQDNLNNLGASSFLTLEESEEDRRVGTARIGSGPPHVLVCINEGLRPPRASTFVCNWQTQKPGTLSRVTFKEDQGGTWELQPWSKGGTV